MAPAPLNPQGLTCSPYLFALCEQQKMMVLLRKKKDAGGIDKRIACPGHDNRCTSEWEKRLKAPSSYRAVDQDLSFDSQLSTCAFYGLFPEKIAFIISL